MSQLPNAGSEPQGGETPKASAQPGTAVAQQAVQTDPNQVAPVAPVVPAGPSPDEFTRLQGEVDRLKGFQKIYTQAHQAGVWEPITKLLDGRKPDEAKATWKSYQDALALKSEIDKRGGWDRVKGDFELLNAEPTGMEPQTPVAPNTDDWVRKADFDQRFDEMFRTRVNQMDVAASKEEVAATIVKEYGLATENNPADPYVLSLISGALDRDLQEVTEGLRDPFPEEIGAAGKRVAIALFDRARASAAATIQPKPGTPAPPGANGRVPGGQQPSKPVSQLTRDEARDAALSMARDLIQPTLDAGPPADAMPAGWEFK